MWYKEDLLNKANFTSQWFTQSQKFSNCSLYQQLVLIQAVPITLLPVPTGINVLQSIVHPQIQK